MAHFAQLENNTVIRVIVIGNDDIKDEHGNESEAIGQAFCQQFGEGTYLQTSYNNSFRKNYAGIRFTYDPQRDAFIPPKPSDDVDFDEETCRWIPKENP
jgi:lipocalin